MLDNIRRWILAPAFEGDEDKSRSAILLNIILWVFIIGALLYGADYDNPAFMGYLVVVICAGLILNWRAAIVWS